MTVRERTIESYRSMVDRHLIPRIGGILLLQLTPMDIDAMLADMGRNGIRPPTRAYALRVLSIALNSAVTKKRLLQYNPALGADKPPVKRRQPVALDRPRAGAFLRAVERDRLAALFVVGIATGLRRGELLALRWSDWDRGAGTISVNATLHSRAGEGFERVTHKTERSVRVVRLPSIAVVALAAHSKRQAEERLASGRRWVDNDLIFTAERRPGGALSGATVVHTLHRLCDRSGIERLRFHDLRHTSATFIAASVGIERAKEVLGHTTLAMTEKYVHMSATSEAAADALDEALSAPEAAIAGKEVG